MYFTNNDLNTIRKYCGDDYLNRINGLIKRISSSNKIKIANTGMYSSGKSSLFNALTDNLENEYFPTGVAPTTKKASSFEKENLVFVDTPGIDVNDHDDSAAFNAVMESDIIVFVHNVKTGKVDQRTEEDWLKRLANGMGSPENCKKRLVFVCTWKEEREKDADYSSFISNMKSRVYEIVGSDIPFFEVSFKKYITGVKKGHSILINNSGINELKRFLNTQAHNYSIEKKQVDAQEFHLLISEIQDLLYVQREKKVATRTKKYSNISNHFVTKRETWKSVFSLFSKKRKQLDELFDKREAVKLTFYQSGIFDILSKYRD